MHSCMPLFFPHTLPILPPKKIILHQIYRQIEIPFLSSVKFSTGYQLGFQQLINYIRINGFEIVFKRL